MLKQSESTNEKGKKDQDFIEIKTTRKEKNNSFIQWKEATKLEYKWKISGVASALMNDDSKNLQNEDYLFFKAVATDEELEWIEKNLKDRDVASVGFYSDPYKKQIAYLVFLKTIPTEPVKEKTEKRKPSSSNPFAALQK